MDKNQPASHENGICLTLRLKSAIRRNRLVLHISKKFKQFDQSQTELSYDISNVSKINSLHGDFITTKIQMIHSISVPTQNIVWNILVYK